VCSLLPFARVVQWLRTLGAKLGKGTEVSTAADYAPDLLEIGDGCFVADSVYLGVPTVYMGQVRMAKLTVGAKTFLGNGACLNLDASIGSDALLGVMSSPPTVKLSKEQSKAPITWPESRAEIADGTSYLGAPPMLLPRRQQSQGTFDAASTFHPTTWLYTKRLTYEFFRITIPFMFMSACMLLYMGNFEYLLFKYNDTYASLTFFWMVIWPCCYVAAAFACCLIVLLFKWVLVGAYTPSEHPLWSSFGQSHTRTIMAAGFAVKCPVCSFSPLFHLRASCSVAHGVVCRYHGGAGEPVLHQSHSRSVPHPSYSSRSGRMTA
jgi:non-ribosomal peptide synthetase-like protein